MEEVSQPSQSDGGLPLGAQCLGNNHHGHDHDSNCGQHHNEHGNQDQIMEEADEEQAHFAQVCRSYQQYATFHQTKQQGVQQRMHQLLLQACNENNDNQVKGKSNKSKKKNKIDNNSNNNNTPMIPTIESILPPTLQPQSSQNTRYMKQQQEFREAVIRNQFFLDTILNYSGVETSQQVLREIKAQNNDNIADSNKNGDGIEYKMASMEWVTEEQMSKVDSVLKSVARDWSKEGEEERGVGYDRILGALDKFLPISPAGEEESPRIAVPGSGLGRLAWEIFARGYSTQGSDFSLPMLLASDFILNGCHIPISDDDEPTNTNGRENQTPYRQFAISPWIAETKNVMSFSHRIRPVIVPDVDPNSASNNIDEDNPCPPEFTMLAGEFLSLYSHFLPANNDQSSSSQNHASQKRFHGIACSFFLDTAPSLPHYLLTIYHMLEDGGLLINFGPLMYHWSGHGALLPSDLAIPNSKSIANNNEKSPMSTKYQTRNAYLDSRYLSSMDYTWEEVRHMIIHCGFEILEEEIHIPSRYTSDGEGMMNVVFDCVFLVARKKAVPST